MLTSPCDWSSLWLSM